MMPVPLMSPHVTPTAGPLSRVVSITSLGIAITPRPRFANPRPSFRAGVFSAEAAGGEKATRRRTRARIEAPLRPRLRNEADALLENGERGDLSTVERIWTHLDRGRLAAPKRDGNGIDFLAKNL